MTGRVIFLTITELPDSEAATSLVLKRRFSNSRRMASATAPLSMMAPSTMLSAGIGSTANAVTLKLLPDGLSSTAFTALDPISNPTTAFGFPNPNMVLFTLPKPVPDLNRAENGLFFEIRVQERQKLPCGGFRTAAL